MRYCRTSAIFSIKKFSSVRTGNEGIRFGFSFGHSAFGAGVTVTILEASKVGVNVGMVGRGVMDAVGDSVGIDGIVFVGVCNTIGVFTTVTSVLVAAGVSPAVT